MIPYLVLMVAILQGISWYHHSRLWFVYFLMQAILISYYDPRHLCWSAKLCLKIKNFLIKVVNAPFLNKYTTNALWQAKTDLLWSSFCNFAGHDSSRRILSSSTHHPHLHSSMSGMFCKVSIWIIVLFGIIISNSKLVISFITFGILNCYL